MYFAACIPEIKDYFRLLKHLIKMELDVVM